MGERAGAVLEGQAPDLLALVHAALAALPEWTAEATEQAVRGVSEAADVKLGQVAQPLRAALTGRATSPGIFDVLVRSEEHTSELQSLMRNSYAVFCLKQKKTHNSTYTEIMRRRT